MQPEEQMSAPRSGSSSGDSTTSEGASTDLQSQNTTLRQELARAKDIMRQAAPIAQLGEMLQNAPGSEAIIAKLRNKQPLTERQAVTATEELRAGGMSKAEIKELLDENARTLEQRMWEGRKAERDMEALNNRAKKEFPGYENVYRSAAFGRLRNIVIAEVQSDPSVIPAGESDPYWWVEAEAWKILKAKNPELIEKPAGKTEPERRGAISGQSTKSGGAPEAQDNDELPDYVKNLGTRRYGGRLSDLRPKGR